jgi:hypothetical protein
MLGIGLLMAGAIIIYLLSEYMTKKLIRRLWFCFFRYVV